MRSCRIVAGERGEGKTSYLLSVSEGARGFVSIHRTDEYYLRDLESGAERLLMSSSPLFPDKIGRWYYDESVFAEANRYLSSLREGTVIVDEIGRLECCGKGFAAGLRALSASDVDVIIAVRTGFVPLVVSAFSLSNATVIPCRGIAEAPIRYPRINR